MTIQQVVALFVRIFAIYVLLTTLRYVGTFFPYAGGTGPKGISVAFLLFLAAFPLLAAYLLWRFPYTVATKIIPAPMQGESAPTLQAVELQTIAYSTVGLFALAWEVPNIFYWSIYIHRTLRTGSEVLDLTPQNIGEIVATGVGVVIGAWLLLGSKGLVGFVRRLRS